MDQLTQLSETIEIAEAAASHAAASVDAARAARGKIGERIAVLTAERRTIVGRRAAGDPRSDDGPRLALIAADLDGLGDLVPGADAAFAAALAAQQQAGADLAAAKAAYAAEEARIALAALDAHADRLVDLLRATLQQRELAALKLPAIKRGQGTIISRGAKLENALLAEIKAARAATSAGPYGRRPTWKPGDIFYTEVTRLRLNEGRFT